MDNLFDKATEEIKGNYEVYKSQQTEMEKTHFGKYLLMHKGKVDLILNDSEDAYQVGCKKFGIGKFSIHKVGERPVDIGVHTLNL